jgi:hypothetical protein
MALSELFHAPLLLSRGRAPRLLASDEPYLKEIRESAVLRKRRRRSLALSDQSKCGFILPVAERERSRGRFTVAARFHAAIPAKRPSVTRSNPSPRREGAFSCA